MLKSSMAFFHVIIPAAGAGSRMAESAKSVLPKQYMLLAGKPIISHTIQTFFLHPRITSIHVALSVDDAFWRTLQLDPASKLKLHYTGGASRSETVLNTLQAINVADDDWVLVHDAARPGLTHALLDKLLNALENDAVGGLLALPVADTLKKSGEHHKIEQTVERTDLWQAQTPQMFKYGVLKHALQANIHAASSHASSYQLPTDESEAIEALGLQPTLVPGELRNLKITYPQDLALLEALFKQEINKQEDQ
jgi:2-C-methyl-D-erythritol 4-phosphate cytidylyltransferase